jgi:NADH dehydrogenase
VAAHVAMRCFVRISHRRLDNAYDTILQNDYIEEMQSVILVTGATGFVGGAVVPSLLASGHAVRCLARPSGAGTQTGNEPRVELAAAGLDDPGGLRAALVGVDTVVHLASAQRCGGWDELMQVDYAGTRQLLSAGRDIGVRRFVYLSHLGAERASAFAVLRAKGIIEQFVRNSGIPYTIIRSAALFGREDSFTNVLCTAMRVFPFVFPRPAAGKARLQPFWIGDFAACLCQVVAEGGFADQTISVGGPEFMATDQLLKAIMKASGISRGLVSVPLPQLRFMVSLLSRVLPSSPLATNWLNFISRDSTCEINSAYRYFGLRPERFEQNIEYLSRWSRR